MFRILIMWYIDATVRRKDILATYWQCKMGLKLKGFQDILQKLQWIFIVHVLEEHSKL